MPDIMMDLLGSMLPAPEYATKEYVQARIAEAMNTAGSGPGVVLEPVTFNANGTYQPDPGKAWDEVEVDVPALEIASGTITLAHDVRTLTFTHNLGSYDVFVFVTLDSVNLESAKNLGIPSGSHTITKLSMVFGTLNSNSGQKTFRATSLASNNAENAMALYIDQRTTINDVWIGTPNAVYFRTGITYNYCVVKYGNNTTIQGGA